MLVTGTILSDRYEIQRLLEEGGMSVVYAAWDRSLRARVAVKEMKGAYSDETEKKRVREQFQMEASMLANLSHPGLPRVTNYFDTNETSYLVMDFIDGDSLERLVNRYRKPAPEGLVLMWAYEICEVLDYLHTRQPPVIFRDLKPSNVMVMRDGHCKVIDFGISKIFDQTNDGATRTAIRGAGTPGYQPPEQYGKNSGRRTDPRSDIYALGGTLYSLLTLQVPTEATDRFMHHIPLQPVHEISDVSSELSAMIDKMMRLEVDERYASARDVMKELQPLLGGVPPREPIELPAGMMRPPSPMPAPVPLVSTNGGTDTLLPAHMPRAPVTAPTTPTILAVTPPAQLDLTHATTARPRPTSNVPALIGVVVAMAAVAGVTYHFASPSTSAATTPSPAVSTSASASTIAMVTPASPSPSPKPEAPPSFHLVVVPPDAVVKLNGAVQKASSSGTYDVPVSAFDKQDSVDVALTCKGFVPVTVSLLTQKAGETKRFAMIEAGGIKFEHGVKNEKAELPAEDAHKLPTFTAGVKVPHQQVVLPASLKGLPPGLYRINLTAPGYVSATVPVTVVSGQMSACDGTLKKVPAPPPPPPPVHHDQPHYIPPVHTPVPPPHSLEGGQ